jgi:diguanylate cyclase (GGDEF)-like protein/PAS domain S-box-containing protein
VRDANGKAIRSIGTVQDITERKQLMELLKESELRYHTVADYTSDWEYWIMPDNTFCYVSPSCEQISGYTPDEFYANPQLLPHIIHPDDLHFYAEHRHQISTHGVPEPIDFRIHTKDGEICWISHVCQPVYDPAGHHLGQRASNRDITKRKKAENALQESEARLRVMLENELVGIVTVKDRIIQWANPAYERVLGYEKGELNGAPARLIFMNDDAYQALGETAYPVINSGKVFRTELEYLRKDGSHRTVDVSAGILNPETGESLWTCVDITERKKAESELLIAATAFESQEGMNITDANGTILRVNRAFTRITGYTAEEAIGKSASLLKSGRHDANFYTAMWDSLHRTGAWEGEIWNRRKNGDVYPEHLTITAVKNAEGIVTNYVSTLTDITLTKAAEDEIKHLAFYDPLTRLPNRRLLLDRLRQALASRVRSGLTGALLFIDLDNFKTLNDTLGHDIGDLLLQQVAKRLESCVREGDTVARLGGDEFVVMLEDLSKTPLEAAEQTESVGNKILATLNHPYQLATHEYRNTPSIGATLFNNNSQSIDELLKQADIAMYQSKKAGRNSLHFFDPQMQETINFRASLEGELRVALENNQFQLYYQIQVDGTKTNGLHRPLGAEALIRWIHPERGVVSPADFIPLAEETGLILPIGQWVLDTACAQIKTWQEGAIAQSFVLAVNVSANQFRQPDFVAQVQAAVQHHAIKPSLLKLELTESLLLENIEDTIATMNALNEFGVQFSLDDFGTGYSSLQYLKRLPLHQLKIDQSFVRDIATDNSDKAIVRTIIAMANSLNMNVIAEGVETEEQLKFLLKKGCTHYQGYLFGKPMPIEQFEAQLKRD